MGLQGLANPIHPACFTRGKRAMSYARERLCDSTRNAADKDKAGFLA
jgi:hypothetical protein